MSEGQESRVASPLELVAFFFAVVLAMALAAVLLVDASIIVDPIKSIFALVTPQQLIQ